MEPKRDEGGTGEEARMAAGRPVRVAACRHFKNRLFHKYELEGRLYNLDLIGNKAIQEKKKKSQE